MPNHNPPETQRARRGHRFYPSEQELATIPRLYATRDRSAADIMIHLHYFVGGCDWWIAEYDPDTRIGYGYACLGDPTCAEWGNIDIAELEAVTVARLWVVERDLHWDPQPAGTLVLPGWRNPS